MREIEFRHVLEDYENMVYYLIHKLGIRDTDGEFYQEGIIALWKASQSYNPKRGKFSSYAYFLIEKALIGLMKQQHRKMEKEQYFKAIMKGDSLVKEVELEFDPYLIREIRRSLTPVQWNWFYLHILQDKSIKEIACEQNVSIDAVKNWGRRAKPKLKKLFS
ncbi:sigma-70 family RNA polymerase sigma factor [Radiobacillus deserti]|uniref:Sigma-70 family RNA polymerase sigma factor n=1 Tax=Radiobacillus deserti TaxID=2594883 RepID=A0A516KJ55_9BACI|nr:sigma-70 family RNA polymerase sigma factor [Radiobacillus deserti]QDP41430.1 sigma-70 family RNA polymerase sigma factor [Radiobacillus deserti]